ncbi:MAG: penicillin-binding protein 1C [Candidatus Eremiobacteraeota bacterium]|nr:penicillin-binding protein 1C [Candidatus Eremiobacteraeota bacterium]
MRWTRKRILISLAALTLCAVIVRCLPLVAPIRAGSLGHDGAALEFTDRNGLLLGVLLSRDQEHTSAVALNAVSPAFVQAIVAAEDARFYEHGAVDYHAMLRAAGQAVRERGLRSGASTITMQLARMGRPLPSGVAGKALQIWTAWRLEAGMSKAQLLEAYVNRLPMGGNVYGVEAAARSYFGVHAYDLDLAQASLLAAIPNNPSGLHPYDHWRELKQRQHYVLGRMLAAGTIDRAEVRHAAAEHILLRERGEGIVAAPHFVFWLAGQVPSGETRITTSIDRPLQRFVEGQVRQVIAGLSKRNVHHAAALVIDNRSGEVLAYVGSPDYFSDSAGGRTDGVQALRQPGSALKPFLYELAFERRIIHPNTILADVPAHYAIPGGLLYSPKDYNDSFLGPVRTRIALADSLNVPAVRVLAMVGVPTFLDRLHALGFDHLTAPPDHYGLGLTLGGGEVSLWELTRAYVTLARGGRAIRLQTLAPSAAQETLAAMTPDPVQTAGLSNASAVESPNPTAAWSLVTDMLADEHARARAFGLGSVLDVPFAAAVKTGTSSDYRDTWTVGFTRDYTVGVWVGNFDGQPMRQVSGVTGAAPLWSRIIMHLHDRSDPQPFAPPAGLVLEPICTDTGLRPGPGCAAVAYEYLYPQDLSQYHMRPASNALPPVYERWAMEQRTDAGYGRFKIVFPRDGDVFAWYPARRELISQPQALLFRSNRGTRAVKWFLNERPWRSDNAGPLVWPLQPGSWTLRAVNGAHSDRVIFEVVAARHRVLRRGFSLVPHG